MTLDDIAKIRPDGDFAPPEGNFNVASQVLVDADGVRAETTGEQVGFVHRRLDGSRLLLVGKAGCAYSWQGSYTRWEHLHQEAMIHWCRYREVAHPLRLTRLGVRFVNRIDIPSSQVEIKDYLRTAIDVSTYLPQSIFSYFLQVRVPLRTDGTMATITSTTVPPPDPNTTSLILDIDVSQEPDLDLAGSDNEADLERRLGVLREAKNHTFEACITDGTRGLIR